MSYAILKAGIVANLGALGYQESQYLKVESMPSSEYGNTFILTRENGENDENTSETISSLVYDIQKWEVKVLFPRSSENQAVEYDLIQAAVDALIQRLDAPNNWESYARIQKYKNWNVQELPNYYILTVELKVIDTIIY